MLRTVRDIELREFRYFVAVAEELNFRRAAQRLTMAQPPLSKAIRQLEARLEVQLFERSTRHVSLTKAGQVLLDEARMVLDAAAAASRRAHRAGHSAQRLLLGVKAGGDSGLLKEILDAYRANPDVPHAEVIVSSWDTLENMLRDGRIDVALVRTPVRGAGLHLESLVTEPRLAVLPAEHRLAGKRQLVVSELADEVFPRWQSADDVVTDYWCGRDPESLASVPSAQRVTVQPGTGPVVSDILQLLTVVALGQAVALLPASMIKEHNRNNLVCRPVKGLSSSTVSVAWPESSRSMAVAAFVRASSEAARNRPEKLTSLA